MRFIPCNYTIWEIIKDVVPWVLSGIAIFLGRNIIKKLLTPEKATFNLLEYYKKILKEKYNVNLNNYIKDILHIVEDVFIIPEDKTFKNYFYDKCDEAIKNIVDNNFSKWDSIPFVPSIITKFSENVETIVENKIVYERYIRKNNVKTGSDEIMLVYANYNRNIIIQIYCRERKNVA
jgi:hypothetical protein